MAQLKAGTRMRSAVCATEVMVVAAPADDVEVTWRLLTPVLETWQNDEAAPYEYAAGSDSFAEADGLIESDGRKWRNVPDS